MILKSVQVNGFAIILTLANPFSTPLLTCCTKKNFWKRTTVNKIHLTLKTKNMKETKVKALNKDMVDYPFYNIVIEDGEDSCIKVAVAAELHADEDGPDATGRWVVIVQGDFGTYTCRIYRDDDGQLVSNNP